MRELTWNEAIETAKLRRDNMNGMPLYVMFNGANGDFNSLRSRGMIGRMEENIKRGEWYVNTGRFMFYLHSGATVWITWHKRDTRGKSNV